MRFVFTADLHFHRYGQDHIGSDGLPEHLSSLIDSIDYMVEYCRNKKISTIIIGGDIYHGKSMIYSPAQNILLDIIRKNWDIDFMMFDGNHDLSHKSEVAASSLKPLENEKNVTILKSGYLNDDILIVPFSYGNMVETIIDNRAKYLLSHFGLNEGTLNNGISIISDIGLSDLVGRYTYVLLGHYHSPQVIELPDNDFELYYTGSLIQIDWNDKRDVKRFLDVNTDTDEIISVPSKGFKKFIEIHISDENKDEEIKRINLLKSDGHHLKVILSDSIDPKDIDIKDVPIISLAKSSLHGISGTMSEDEMLDKYMTAKGISGDIAQVFTYRYREIVEKCSGAKVSDMNDIFLKKLIVSNYGPFTSSLDVEVEPGKLILISGPNGSGKTMLVDAFPYALYGVTSKGLKVDEVVSNIAGENCQVNIEFYLNDKSFTIDRYRKHKKFGDTVLLKDEHGKPFRKGHTEVVEFIESVLGSARIFMNTMFFAQKVKDFFTDVTDSSRRVIFRDLLQLGRFPIYYKEADKDLKKANQILIDINKNIDIKNIVLSELMDQLQRVIKEKEEFYKSKELNLIQLNADIDKLISDLDLKRHERSYIIFSIDEFEKQRDQMVLLKNHIEEATKKRNGIIEEFRKKEEDLKAVVINEYDKLRSSVDVRYESEKLRIISLYDTEISKIRDQIAALELHTLQRHIDTLKSDLNSLSKNYNNLCKSISDKICSQCGQKTNIDAEVRLKASIQKMVEQIEPLKKEYDNKSREYKELLVMEADLTREICSMEDKKKEELEILEIGKDKECRTIDGNKISKFEEVTRQIESDIEDANVNSSVNIDNMNSELTQLLKQIHEQKECIERSNRLDKEIIELHVSIEYKRGTINEEVGRAFDEQKIIDIQLRISTINMEIEQLKGLSSTQDIECRALDLCKQAFSPTGMASLLISRAIPSLNYKISEYLEMMGGRFVVSFDMFKETKEDEFQDKVDIRILDTVTLSDSVQKLSGGQKRIIDVAIFLAFADLYEEMNGIRTNLRIFDEVFDSLDESNISYVSTILKDLSRKSNKTIIVISHFQIANLESDTELRIGV